MLPFLPFQNVLRELEQKKPQLDELVQTAESIKDGSAPSANKQHLPAQGILSLTFFFPSRHLSPRDIVFLLFMEAGFLMIIRLRRLCLTPCT